MPAVRIYFAGDRVGPLFQRSTARLGDRVREAARAAAFDAVQEIRERGAADMAGAGNFGTRWTDGLNATVKEGGGNIRIDISHQVPYFGVFQYGATIKGKPLLWIPMSFATDAIGVNARSYPGILFRVDRKRDGLPLLLAPAQGIGGKAEVKYFGKEQVTIPKKFHIVEIVSDVAKHYGEFFRARFRIS